MRGFGKTTGLTESISMPACLPPHLKHFSPPASNCIFLGDYFKEAGRNLCRPRAKRKMSPFKP